MEDKPRVPGRERLPASQTQTIIPAASYQAGNLNNGTSEFGEGVVIDGGQEVSFAEYALDVPEEGRYEFWGCYAAQESRPLELYCDGKLVSPEAFGGMTSGWTDRDARWFKEAVLDLSAGCHVLKLATNDVVPHLYRFALLKGVKQSAETIFERPSAFLLLKDKVRTFGFRKSTAKLFDYIRSGRLAENYLDIMGIFNGQYAFKGPFHVQIDVTNNCNNNCIACWCNSPLLEERMLAPTVKAQELPFAMVTELLDELAASGTKEIYFSGSGEPFMHPRLLDILAHAKSRHLTCYVNTNFTLLDKEKIKRLIDIGVDHLTVSTWAGTARTYAATHPNKDEATFRQIVENLAFLNATKKRTPHIKLYNVIFNLNYHELDQMIELAEQTHSESVEFTLIDTMPGKTDKLLLSPQESKELQASSERIAGRMDFRGRIGKVLLFRFDTFLRRVSSSQDLASATYDRNIIDKMPCYIGWCFARVIPNGDVHACLKAHRIPSGNLFKERFGQIWNNEKQRHFRKKTLVYTKSDPFFRCIGNDPNTTEAGCYKSCDDIGRNAFMHNRIMSLTFLERAALKLMAKFRRAPAGGLGGCGCGTESDPLLAGIADGRKALSGPEHVVVDITNRCNLQCIGCWLYSPLLRTKPDPAWLKQEIPLARMKALIDDLAALGTQRIRLTGGGEPFMHPQIMQVLDYAKKKGLLCCLTTNFTLLDKKKIDALVAMGLDELAISLWAAQPKTYLKLHPGTAEGLFERLAENISYLTAAKSPHLKVTLCNVISNRNYAEVWDMYAFAVSKKVDGVYFTLIDSVPGTDTLLLSAAQQRNVLAQAERIKGEWGRLALSERIGLDYFDGFLERLKQTGSETGNYDCERVNRIPCYVGWYFARILPDGAVSPCCRGVNKVMGNVNEESFRDIWQSPVYNEFRMRAKHMPKTDPYFAPIGCVKMCDNLMHNEMLHRTICNRSNR